MGRAPRLNRGDVYTARLDPVEGSEQGGVRPVAIVSRDIINRRASFVIAVPLTTYRGQRLLPSQSAVQSAFRDQVRMVRIPTMPPTYSEMIAPTIPR